MIEGFPEYIIQSMRDVPTGISVGLILVSCLGPLLILVLNSGTKGIRCSAGLLLVAYVFLLYLLTIFVRKAQLESRLDLTPFWSYRAIREGNEILLIQVIMNVLVFIPIGLLLGIISDRMKWWKVLLIGLGCSAIIETLQFVLRRGYSEFDDVFHNTMGCLVGYGVYVGIEYIVRRVRLKHKERETKQKRA